MNKMVAAQDILAALSCVGILLVLATTLKSIRTVSSNNTLDFLIDMNLGTFPEFSIQGSRKRVLCINAKWNMEVIKNNMRVGVDLCEEERDEVIQTRGD